MQSLRVFSWSPVQKEDQSLASVLELRRSCQQEETQEGAPDQSPPALPA